MRRLALVATVVAVLGTAAAALAQEVFAPEDVLNTEYATTARISPDGKWVAYTVSVPRAIDEDAGGRYVELHVVSTADGKSRRYVTGKVNVSSPRWSPDGQYIAFRQKRGDDKATQVWVIPFDGGEPFRATDSKTNVSSHAWHPSGDKIAYIATTPKSKRQKALAKKGYGFKYFDENLQHRNLYIVNPLPDGAGETKQLTEGITVWSFAFSPDGETAAIAVSPKNLVDHRYAFQKVHLLDIATGEHHLIIDNPGKLGNFRFSPDGSRIVFTAALTQSDHAVSQVFVVPAGGGEPKNLTPPDFRGHVAWASWKDNKTVVYWSGEGVWRTVSTVKAAGGERKVVLHSKEVGVNVHTPTFTPGMKHIAFVASAANVPSDVYYSQGGKSPKRLTELNPWIADRKLGRQEVITYKARDGYEVEGLLIYPVDYDAAQSYPLMVAVHGGPESHHSNEWRTSYSRPAQVLAGEGYAVFLPNYRASTGYGLEHTAQHLGDAAGVEFDDVADGIRHLIDMGIADPDRVGLGGGSYGGYAAAWFATYYTDLVKAAVMFVGISNLISKRSTTDIPYEELYVHSGKKLEEMWEMSLERSPIYHAHKSRTATLIIGGTADPRVHPAQSIELFRRMKMNDHPAVRLVQYPGEPHGNRKMPGRRDVLLRTLQWYNWYVKNGKPVDGEMPGWDISDQYGLDLPEENAEEPETDDTIP